LTTITIVKSTRANRCLAADSFCKWVRTWFELQLCFWLS